MSAAIMTTWKFLHWKYDMKDAGKSDNWVTLSPAEKKQELFRRQKELLDTFLSTGAISQAQHDKSLSWLIEKMGIKEDQQWATRLIID